MEVLVAVATYRRPAGLLRLLKSLDGDAGRFDVLVVDNDAERSAWSTVADGEFRRRPVYVVEPEPGIAPARNRALSYAISQDYTALVFVDDDEVVVRGWFEALSSAMISLSADVVCGPVIAAYEDGVARWARKGGFFERPRQATGTVPRWPATNNVIIRITDEIRLGTVSFRLQYSMTGGEDTDFFMELKRLGSRLAWCDEAAVVEYVPAPRASARWLWRRGMRLGNVTTRRMSRAGFGWAAVPVGLLRVALAIPLAVLKSLLRGSRGIGELMHLPKGIGMLQAAFGGKTVEYGR
ncbi:glycosyltransferase family 2 protein [Micromonospora sicca]|uniref:Glycosyltransferase family 2 protein n=1 Tax=Micromonospora sicca TaxID=2202420 RepID=A0A317DHU0_9ACTN|nr:glycosyltransferase [Micromonospora sp. 4G51]PWR14309.1 glycosyltransferase family 2 protein [Micromonospora sp. 4G51]